MIIKLIILLIIWYLANLLFVVITIKLKGYRGQITANIFNPWLETLELFGAQLMSLKNLIKFFIVEQELVRVQNRKIYVLKNVVNHLNERLMQEISIKMMGADIINGVDVWIYLANNLSSTEKNKLEEYFAGVLSKYTNEFALDVLNIVQNAGAGWVGKFDVKPIEEATYNRMARQSSVENEEDF